MCVHACVCMCVCMSSVCVVCVHACVCACGVRVVCVHACVQACECVCTHVSSLPSKGEVVLLIENVPVYPFTDGLSSIFSTLLFVELKHHRQT